MTKERVIVEAETENLILANRAASWLLAQPKSQKDAILSFGDVDFYVKRNKASVSCRQL